MKKSVKFHKMARHLVEKCGLFPWFSSVLLISSESHRRDETLCLLQLGVVSEVITETVVFFSFSFTLSSLVNYLRCLHDANRNL